MERAVKKSAVKWLMAAICVGLFGLIAFGALTLFGPDEVVWRREIRAGDELIQAIEAYRREHRFLPSSIEKTGLRDSDALRVFYEKCGDSRYLVWFGTTLGESMSYSSVTRKWESRNRRHTCDAGRRRYAENNRRGRFTATRD